jgi:hypothetical protein
LLIMNKKKIEYLKSIPEWESFCFDDSLVLISKLNEILDWCDANGLPKSRSNNELEKKYQSWINHRREAKTGHLYLKHYDELDVICFNRGYEGLLNRQNRDGLKEAIMKLETILDWCDKNQKRPSLESLDKKEKQHAAWLASKRQAKLGKKWKNGSLVCYEELDLICKKRGYRDLLNRIDNKQKAINRLNEVLNWCDKKGKMPSSWADDPIEKKHAGWLSSRRQAKVRRNRSVHYEELDTICCDRGYPNILKLK